MSSTIYILTDGTNAKIGKTINFDKRMSSYNTHNANYQLVKSYSCSDDEATRVETLIKHLFKDSRVGNGKEWFAVPASEIDNYVSVLLFKPTISDVKPSSHGVKLTQEAHQLKEEILLALADRGKSDVAIKKELLASLFATKFGLGIPEHKLPFDDILVKDGMNVDLNHCADPKQSELVRHGAKHNHIQMPFDDHCYRFFHLYKLATGYYVAFCTAEVSMPYIEVLSDENQEKIFDSAKEVGWDATVHNDWSWHSPNKTGLVLFQPKTSITKKIGLFEKSFRKWVIENQVVLQQEKFGDKEWLKKVIEDVSYDNSFPLDIQSFEELCEKYLGVFWGMLSTEDDEDWIDWQKRAYLFLFEKWNKLKQLKGSA